jgi:hypothetical protein
MHISHPIGTAFTVSAVPTRDDLFADCMVSNFESIQFGGTIPESHYFTDKLMTRGYRGLAVTYSMFVTPKKGGARVTLYVAGAHAGAPNLEKHFARTRFWNRTFFEPIIMRAMRHHGRHGFWKFVDYSTHGFVFWLGGYFFYGFLVQPLTEIA